MILFTMETPVNGSGHRPVLHRSLDSGAGNSYEKYHD